MASGIENKHRLIEDCVSVYLLHMYVLGRAVKAEIDKHVILYMIETN